MSRRKLRKTLRTVTTAWNYGSSSTATYKGTGSQLRHFVKMGEQMSLKIAYVIALIVAGVLGIVALGLNDNFGKSSVSRVRCSDAFTVIAVILLLASAILFLVVMFLKTDAARIILIVTFVAAAVGRKTVAHVLHNLLIAGIPGDDVSEEQRKVRGCRSTTGLIFTRNIMNWFNHSVDCLWTPPRPSTRSKLKNCGLPYEIQTVQKTVILSKAVYTEIEVMEWACTATTNDFLITTVADFLPSLYLSGICPEATCHGESDKYTQRLLQAIDHQSLTTCFRKARLNSYFTPKPWNEKEVSAQ
ncbi:hypothetical protein CLF_107608 [Clonorchis sinensis]|uniref:Uncharacterized protein n=1 Tax=Clonorchis sinensis TaxID=79923 RepID=G7YQV0_CLOSI|nr:hypothetical protein CLF_107608 [Clonorchis sinensis]